MSVFFKNKNREEKPSHVCMFSDCYSPSLIPLKPFSKSRDIEASIEAQSFGQLKCKNSSHITPSTTYVNNFYVYPISLNYNSQKGMKVSVYCRSLIAGTGSCGMGLYTQETLTKLTQVNLGSSSC